MGNLVSTISENIPFLRMDVETALAMNQTNPALSIPSLVIEQVLDQLEFSDLKNLRLVCKTTKSWVEQPRYLQKFEVAIPGPTRCNQVRESNVEWVTLSCSGLLNYRTNSLPDMLRVYQSSLQSLTISCLGRTDYFATGPLIRNILQHLGPQLKILRLLGHIPISYRHLHPNQKQQTFDNSLISRKYLENVHLTNLRELCVIPPYYSSPDLVRLFLEILLECCPNLNNIQFPTMSTFSLKSEPLPPPQVNPFVAYVEKLAQKPKEERPTKFLLDFCSDFDLIDSDSWSDLSWAWWLFPLDKSSLVQLSSLCERIGGKLMNVPLESLPTLDEAANLTPAQLKSLDSCLGSVISRVDLSSGLWDFCQGRTGFSAFQMPEDARVTSITYESAQDQENITNQHVLFAALFQVVRPTMTSLRLTLSTCNVLSYSATHPQNLSHFFPNLKKLCIEGSSSADLVHMLENLPSGLQELELVDCDVYESVFFSGDPQRLQRWNKPYLNRAFRLKSLMHLRLWECDIRRRSGNSSCLESLLAELNLKTFAFKKKIPYFSADNYH